MSVRQGSDSAPAIAPQRAVLEVKEAAKGRGGTVSEGAASYIEECVVRRELSDNFCYYNPDYDSLDGAAQWAQDTLEAHADDKRPQLYSFAQLEGARTHEDIWNAAQRQLVYEGKMHGFMRMYWAKKILEWSPSPAEALSWANALNDKYSIDGRDPNGYVGVAWSIMGVHDMGWKERDVFGKIRYMNYNGCKRKFDVGAYASSYSASRMARLNPFVAAAPKVKAEAKQKVDAKAEGKQEHKHSRKRKHSETVSKSQASSDAAATQPKDRKKARKALLRALGSELLAQAIEAMLFGKAGSASAKYKDAVRAVHTFLVDAQSGPQRVGDLQKMGQDEALQFVERRFVCGQS